MCVPRSLLLLGICCTSSIVLAASKTEKADRVVNAVLEQEVRGEVHERRGQLGDLVDQTDRARWAAGYIKTADGWQRFDTPQSIDDRLREYEQRRGTEPLTPEQHLELANWCREKKLNEQERAHLWSAVAALPNRVVELRRLGLEYNRGVWITKEEMRRQERDQLSWERNLRGWLNRLQSLKRSLSDSNTQTQAIGRANLLAIDEIEALPALETELAMYNSELASDYIDWAKSKPHVQATISMARQSFLSPWEIIRIKAAEGLRDRRLDHTMPVLLNALSTPSDYSIRTTRRTIGKSTIVAEVVAEREAWDHLERRYFQAIVGPQLQINIDPRRSQVRTRRVQYRFSELDLIDLQRQQNDFSLHVKSVGDDFNREVRQRNEMISASLSRISGFPANQSPQEWWATWNTIAATDAPVKGLVEVSETEVLIPLPQVRTASSCLPAGTNIVAGSGLAPVESLQIGDLVLAKDIDTGELSYKPVIRTTVRSPQPLVTLHTKDDSIRATLGHYFWVSGQGWRMAKEIKPGDRLHGVDGTITVTDVSRGGREAVYNLVVEGANTYFVGNGKILSHDVTPPVPTDIIVPGLAAR